MGGSNSKSSNTSSSSSTSNANAVKEFAKANTPKQFLAALKVMNSCGPMQLAPLCTAEFRDRFCSKAVGCIQSAGAGDNDSLGESEVHEMISLISTVIDKVLHAPFKKNCNEGKFDNQCLKDAGAIFGGVVIVRDLFLSRGVITRLPAAGPEVITNWISTMSTLGQFVHDKAARESVWTAPGIEPLLEVLVNVAPVIKTSMKGVSKWIGVVSQMVCSAPQNVELFLVPEIVDQSFLAHLCREDLIAPTAWEDLASSTEAKEYGWGVSGFVSDAVQRAPYAKQMFQTSTNLRKLVTRFFTASVACEMAARANKQQHFFIGVSTHCRALGIIGVADPNTRQVPAETTDVNSLAKAIVDLCVLVLVAPDAKNRSDKPEKLALDVTALVNCLDDLTSSQAGLAALAQYEILDEVLTKAVHAEVEGEAVEKIGQIRARLNLQ